MKKIAIVAAFLLLTACQGTLLPPSDGIYGSDLGTTLTLQGGRCVQASVCEAVVSHYGDTPRSWSCSSGIQTSGHAPDYHTVTLPTKYPGSSGPISKAGPPSSPISILRPETPRTFIRTFPSRCNPVDGLWPAGDCIRRNSALFVRSGPRHRFLRPCCA